MANKGHEKGVEHSAEPGVRPLPCLNSNNPIEHENSLSSNHRKTAFCLEFNIRQLAHKYGLDNLGFLTLTFPDKIDRKEVYRRWNSLATNFLRKRYKEYLAVIERGSVSGRLHFHLLVVCRFSIRDGFDFEEAQRGRYSSANPELRREWACLRSTLPKYGFGRHELLPIKTTEGGISKYVGKYISKHIGARLEQDKGMRLVRYSKGARSASNRFMFATKNSKKWRELVAGIARECGFSDIADFKEHFGSSWAYALQSFVEGQSTAGQHIQHARNRPDSVNRAWLPMQHTPIPQVGSNYSPRKEWTERLRSASERAFRRRFRRFLDAGPPSNLDILNEQSKGVE